MPDTFDANGLVVKTASEITTALVTGLQSIYGSDIQTDQNSPDGQMVGILTQMAVDIREKLVDINNGFDPDLATGAILDQRVALNDIRRAGGTYTTQPIDIVVSQTVNLAGLDDNYDDPLGVGYTIQDANGNKFILIDSVTLTVGSYSLSFRAQKIGSVSVPTNTITSFVTIVPGVTSVNNSSAATSVGSDQETDAQLRVRRRSSVSNSSSGYLNGLEGNLQSITGVIDAAVYENYTDTVDANGIPAHGIWCVVEGGANTDIADMIYRKKDPGANMRGSVAVVKTTPAGRMLTVKFDRPTATPLYIRFNIKTTVSGYAFNTASIKDYISTNLSYDIGSFAETSSITDAAIAAIAAQGGGGVPVAVQVSSDGVTWVSYLDALTLASQWTVSSANIAITVLP